MVHRRHPHRHFHVRREGLVIGTTGAPHVVSTTQTIALTNAANPALATRFLDLIDILNGTELPTLASSDTTKLVVVTGPAAPTGANGGLQMPFACYPVDAAAETDDAVTVTITPPAGD